LGHYPRFEPFDAASFIGKGAIELSFEGGI
jgi:hypothetical protein